MNPIRKAYTIVATDADGIATTQTPLAAGNLTLDGVLISGGTLTLSTAQHVSIACAGADAARSFVVTGTDSYGNAQTEIIAGSAGSTTKGTKNFKTVTSISVDAATAGAVTAGVLGELETQWLHLDNDARPFNVGYHVKIGTATFTVEGTMSDLLTTPGDATAFTVQASGSASVANNTIIPMTGIRLKITAFTTGSIDFNIIQP